MDWMIFKVFCNLNDSLILHCLTGNKQKATQKVSLVSVLVTATDLFYALGQASLTFRGRIFSYEMTAYFTFMKLTEHLHIGNHTHNSNNASIQTKRGCAILLI